MESYALFPTQRFLRVTTSLKSRGTRQDSVVLALLRYGDKGEFVRSAQLLLIGRGYSCGWCGADGEIGQDTCNAVIAYQRACGLQQDGIIGAQTWARLIGG